MRQVPEHLGFSWFVRSRDSGKRTNGVREKPGEWGIPTSVTRRGGAQRTHAHASARWWCSREHRSRGFAASRNGRRWAAMRKRGFSVCSGGGERSRRAPLGQLAASWAAIAGRIADRSADGNVVVSSVFDWERRRQPEQQPDAGVPLGALQSVLEGAQTVSRDVTSEARWTSRARDQGRDGALLEALAHSLARLQSRARVAGRDELDRLIEFRDLKLLSAHELLVVCDAGPMVLHSRSAITSIRVERFRSMKLALNSQCCYVLYNDVHWYMRWRFF